MIRSGTRDGGLSARLGRFIEIRPKAVMKVKSNRDFIGGSCLIYRLLLKTFIARGTVLISPIRKRVQPTAFL